MAGVAGALAREHFIGAREQSHLDRAPRLGRFERVHEGVDAVVAGERGQPEIGDDEPLGREHVGVVLGRARGLRHQHVDAGRQRADGVGDREGRGDVGVEGLLDRHRAFPDLGAALLGQAADVIAVEIALKIASDDGLEQVAIAEGAPLSFLSVPGAKDVGIEIHSCSKGFDMIGWRLG